MDTWGACVDPIASPYNDYPEVLYCFDEVNKAMTKNGFTTYTDLFNEVATCLYTRALIISFGLGQFLGYQR